MDSTTCSQDNISFPESAYYWVASLLFQYSIWLPLYSLHSQSIITFKLADGYMLFVWDGSTYVPTHFAGGGCSKSQMV